MIHPPSEESYPTVRNDPGHTSDHNAMAMNALCFQRRGTPQNFTVDREIPYPGKTFPANSRSAASSMGPLLATTHKSSPRSRRLPAVIANPAACNACVSVFSVKPVLCAM